MWLYLEKHLQLRSFLWISRSCKPSSCVFGALAWKIWPVSDSIIFWGQSWRYLDYWRIFANSLRVELHSMFWHSIILDKISLKPRLWRFLDKCCHSTEHLFKHTKPSTTWINRYVHPGVSWRAHKCWYMKLVEGRDLCTRVRKACRLQTIVGANLFSSHKYRSNADMLRSLDGHSCDFQWAP